MEEKPVINRGVRGGHCWGSRLHGDRQGRQRTDWCVESLVRTGGWAG